MIASEDRLREMFAAWEPTHTPCLNLLNQIMAECTCTLEKAYQATEFLFPSRGIDQ